MEITEKFFENKEYFLKQSIADVLPEDIVYPNQKDIETEFRHDDNNISFSTETSIPKFNKNFIQNIRADFMPILACKLLDDALLVCGPNFIKRYIKANNKEFQTEAAKEFKISESEREDFLCIDVTRIPTQDQLASVVAIGTSKNFIKIFDLHNLTETNRLIGHTNKVNDLKFSKMDPAILISASKDHSIRFWNVTNAILIAIFGGLQAHTEEILSIDLHIDETYLASSGIDCSIKVWDIDSNLQQKFTNSYTEKDPKSFIATIKSVPVFSSRDVHSQYIDCVKFNGNFIVSKSVDGVIKEFLPDFKNNSYFLINTYAFNLHSKIYSVKFELDLENRVILVGDITGNLNMFKIEDIDNEKEGLAMDDFYYTNEPCDRLETNLNTIVRCCSVTEKGMVAMCTATGEIFISQIKYEKNKNNI